MFGDGGVDAVAVSVDPAQGDQVVGIVVAAVGSMLDVVRLEAVSALAAICGAAPVPPQYETTQLGRYRMGGRAVCDRLVPVDDCDLYLCLHS